MTIADLARYRKALVAAIPAVVTLVGEVAGVDSPLYVKAVAVLVALGVYVVPNKA
jgi:hypothetical protein